MSVPLAPANGFRQLMTPVGPVAAAFGICDAFVAGIMGPVGGGKTTECIAKGVRVGLMQRPMWDPSRQAFVRKCRGAVVRDTYPNLDRTVIKSWHQWFPKELGNWSGDAPRRHSFTIQLSPHQGRPSLLDMEVIFTAIGDRAVEDVLRGLELTWLWPNEWDLLPQTILEIGAGRVGRYPGAIDGGCAFSQVFGDFNAPEEDNHTVKLFGIDEDGRPDEKISAAFGGESADISKVIQFFRQPGGMDECAENLHNLPGGRDYYRKQAALLQPDMKRRLIDNRLGPIRHGTPVYPEYRDEYHARDFAIDPRLPILIGADQDICPGAVLAQLDPRIDQLRIFAEFARIFEREDGSIELSQMGGEAFGREVNATIVSAYAGPSIGWACCDPAGSAGEAAIDHASWRRQFQKGLGVPVRPARVPGNALEPRLNAMRGRLKGQVRGEPRLLIHRRCTILRKAFNTRYAWARISVGSIDGGQFGSKPKKVQGYSDVMNAAEYLVFEVDRGVTDDALVPAGALGGGRRAREIVNDMGSGRA